MLTTTRRGLTERRRAAYHSPTIGHVSNNLTPCCPLSTERQYSVLPSRTAGALEGGELQPNAIKNALWLAAQGIPPNPPSTPATLAMRAAMNTERQYSVLSSRRPACLGQRTLPRPQLRRLNLLESEAGFCIQSGLLRSVFMLRSKDHPSPRPTALCD